MSARWAVRLAVAAVVVAVSLSVVDGQGFGRGRGGGRGAPPRDLAGAPVALGTGVISGSVVLEGGATPVRRARVTLTGAELRGGRSVMTDDLGRFTFQALPAGRFTMTASKPGFVAGAYGAKRPGRPGTPIQLADGQKIRERRDLAATRQRHHGHRGRRTWRPGPGDAGAGAAVRDAHR